MHVYVCMHTHAYTHTHTHTHCSKELLMGYGKGLEQEGRERAKDESHVIPTESGFNPKVVSTEMFSFL